jgi:fibronectin type 3 domain-containing protein
VANLTGEYFTWMGSGDNAYASADWSQWKIFSNDTEGSLGAVSSAGTTLPTVPTNLSATAISSSQINLIWTPSTDNAGIASYKIYRGGSEIGTSASNTYSDSGVSAGTTYTYTVVAIDAAGNTSAQSASAAATPSQP